jgi:dTDP-glucose pyrophosphorylase
VTSPDDSELFRELFGNRYRDLRLHYTVQAAPAGVADAVCQAAEWVRGPFVVLLGDCYFDGELRDFAPGWEATGSDGAVLVEPVVAPGGEPMGLVTLIDDRIVRIYKAPWAGDAEWRVCGAFLFPESFFDVAAETTRAASGEYELEDVVSRFIDTGARFTAIPFSGWRRNINTPEDLAAVELRIAAGLDA